MATFTTIENRYLTACIKLLIHCLPFLSTNSRYAINSNFRELINQEFVELEKQFNSGLLDHTFLPLIKYAMAAFIDEIVLCSTWDGRFEWQARSLQLQFFGEHLAGEGFFLRLSQIRQMGIVQINILEIYELCLRLGFQGRYRLQGVEYLQALPAGLREQVEAVQGQVDAQICQIDSALPKDKPIQSNSDIPIWMIAMITTIFILLIYSSFAAIINFQTDKVLKQIHRDVILIEPEEE